MSMDACLYPIGYVNGILVDNISWSYCKMNLHYVHALLAQFWILSARVSLSMPFHARFCNQVQYIQTYK